MPQNSPFVYSDTNKRYHTYVYYLRRRYGSKCARIPIDAGFSCPNREGGMGGCAVYACLFLGKGAYGVVDLSEGTEVIVKPRGSSGTADPLDQRSTVGWKGIHAAAILYDEYMVRVECGSSSSDTDKAN